MLSLPSPIQKSSLHSPCDHSARRGAKIASCFSGAALSGLLWLSFSLALSACAGDDEPGASTDLDASADPAKTADSGSTTADDAGASLGMSDASQPAPSEDRGQGDGTDVIMVGDSWMSLGAAATAIQAGVLKASGQPYRTYSVGGTTLLGGGLLGFLPPIPTQYESAVQADPNIKTVIMTGGGNDILQSGLQEDCDMEGEACAAQVVKILDALSEMWAEMAADGVADVVYIFYATPAGATVDFALPDGDGARARCANVPAPLRCHTLETLDLVMGDIPDGIHPSQVASDRIGQAVFDMMVEHGMRR